MQSQTPDADPEDWIVQCNKARSTLNRRFAKRAHLAVQFRRLDGSLSPLQSSNQGGTCSSPPPLAPGPGLPK